MTTSADASVSWAQALAWRMGRQLLDPIGSQSVADVVRFLPGHDQWVMGPGTKDVQLTPGQLRDLVTRKADPVIAGGVVRGTWARRGDELTVDWLDASPRPGALIAKEAARLGTILGADLRVVPR